MIESPKPYAEYKESEVPWIGKIPQHWQVLPNRALLKLKKKSVGLTSGDYTLLSLTKQGVIPRDLENPSGKFPANFETYQIVEPGDLIFCLFDIDETPRAVGLSNLQGMITGAYTRFACNDPSSTRFVYLFYLAMDNGKLLKPLYSGLRKVITKSTFLSAKTPFPPQEEQAAIVQFLDHANRKIDRFIHDKRRLIELLNEQKQVIIHRAVTRGLNPDVKLKPSGIEWLGDVPKHWGYNAIKRNYIIQLGKMLQNRPNEPDDVEVPYLKAQHIQWFSVRTTNAPTMWANPREIEQFGIRRGDLLVCEGGEGGRSCLIGDVEHGYIIQNALHRVRPMNHSRNEYLRYVMSAVSTTGWFDAINNKATIAHFTKEKFGSLRIPFPPLPEQAAIVEYLDNSFAEIDVIIDRARREIDLLREYRTCLISDVVTGKLDVRDVELPAMDETETLGDIDTAEDIETEAEELTESEEVADADE